MVNYQIFYNIYEVFDIRLKFYLLIIFVFFLLLLKFVVSTNFWLKNPLLVSAIIIFSLTFFSFLFPLFSFVFSIMFSSFLFFLSLPYGYLNTIQNKFLLYSQHLLFNSSLLDFLSVVYIKFFCVPVKKYYLRLTILFISTLFYILTSRWYLIEASNTSINMNTNLLIFFILLSGISLFYLRFLLNISLFIIPLTVKTNPRLLSESVLYVFGENSDTTISDKSTLPQTVNNEKKNFSLINVNRSRQYYRNYYSNTNNTTFRYFSIGLGVCTLCVTAAAAVYSQQQAALMREQTEYSKQQTEYSKQQAYSASREADAAAVEAGLITKEEYWRRHPYDAASKPQK